MFSVSTPVALYMEGRFEITEGKMGYACLRHRRGPIVCAVDSANAGRSCRDVTGIDRDAPVVATLKEAKDLGTEAVVLGIAPRGGRIPPEWMADIDRAVALGLSIVNGLHDRLSPRCPDLNPGQYVWDIRVEPEGLTTASGAARGLKARRALMIGTDMSIGKMTAGLELTRAAQARGVDARFVATGQVGIVIEGAGVPLDAVRVDFAAGAIEREVMRHEGADLIVIEGQGSLAHPSSTSPLPLLRGSSPTHLVLCHRAGMDRLVKAPEFEIRDPLMLARLCADLVEACGPSPRPVLAGVALNTAHLGEDDARAAIEEFSKRCDVPVTDPVRFGAGAILDRVSRY